MPVWFLEPSVLSGCSMPKAMQRKWQGGPSAFLNILRQKTTLVFRWEGDWHQCSQVIRILDTLTVGATGEKHNCVGHWSSVMPQALCWALNNSPVNRVIPYHFPDEGRRWGPAVTSASQSSHRPAEHLGTGRLHCSTVFLPLKHCLPYDTVEPGTK